MQSNQTLRVPHKMFHLRNLPKANEQFQIISPLPHPRPHPKHILRAFQSQVNWTLQEKQQPNRWPVGWELQELSCERGVEYQLPVTGAILSRTPDRWTATSFLKADRGEVPTWKPAHSLSRKVLTSAEPEVAFRLKPMLSHWDSAYTLLWVRRCCVVQGSAYMDLCELRLKSLLSPIPKDQFQEDAGTLAISHT